MYRLTAGLTSQKNVTLTALPRNSFVMVYSSVHGSVILYGFGRIRILL
jgi:hypothetical protein